MLSTVRIRARKLKSVLFDYHVNFTTCFLSASRKSYGAGKQLYCSKFTMHSKLTKHHTFKFTNYDCIGFDLDNTICRYKVLNMVRLEYEVLSNFLVERKGYSPKYLTLPIENDIDFMLKGLILDIGNGNILRIDSNAHIIRGSHGTKQLSRKELKVYYGEDCRWQITDTFARDPLHTWNGPLSEKVRTLLDYFDMPAGLAFARAVDTLDEENKNERLDSYNVWPDIVEALTYMFKKEHFTLEKGGYFPHMKNKPEEYIHKCSQKLIQWFQDLRAEKKVLFLITGSNVDFASHTAENALGKHWKQYFDIVIFFAKKPGFFTEQRPFVGLNGIEEADPVPDEHLEVGQSYTYGNWKGLYEFLKRCSGKEEPKIVYIGDNIIQDVYAPAVHGHCDAVAICEELEAEGVYGHNQCHSEKHLLASKTWGSYFHHKEAEKATIWKEFIRNHAKICIPNLEYITNFPVDHDFLKPDDQ